MSLPLPALRYILPCYELAAYELSLFLLSFNSVITCLRVYGLCSAVFDINIYSLEAEGVRVLAPEIVKTPRIRSESDQNPHSAHE